MKILNLQNHVFRKLKVNSFRKNTNSGKIEQYFTYPRTSIIYKQHTIIQQYLQKYLRFWQDELMVINDGFFSSVFLKI